MEEARRRGTHTGEFIEAMLKERPLDRLRGAQGILRLAKRYGPGRLDAACRRTQNLQGQTGGGTGVKAVAHDEPAMVIEKRNQVHPAVLLLSRLGTHT